MKHFYQISSLTVALFLVLFLTLFSDRAVDADTSPESGIFLCTNVTEIPTTECEALVSLFYSTDGANWVNNAGWLRDHTPCAWHGIGCSEGHVTSLNLGYNELNGHIPPEIGDLTKLISLELYVNNLNGSIPPEIGYLTNLENLQLEYNQLSGLIPPAIGNLTNLEYLHLEYNALSGAIPEEIGNLTNISHLVLSGNRFSGPVPPELGDLIQVDRIYLDQNQLSGPLPNEFSQLNPSIFYFNETQLCLPDTLITWFNNIPEGIGRGRDTNCLPITPAKTQVLISPASQTIDSLNRTADVDIVIEDVTDLYGFTIKITFDPSLIQVVWFSQLGVGVQVRVGDLLDPDNRSILVNSVDNEKGTLELSVTQTYPATPRSGSGIAGSITFQAIGKGEANLSLTEVRLIDNTSQVIETNIQSGTLIVYDTNTPPITEVPIDTITPTPTATATDVVPPTPTDTETPTETPTSTSTSTPTPTPTLTQEIEITPIPTTETPTPTPTSTPGGGLEGTGPTISLDNITVGVGEEFMVTIESSEFINLSTATIEVTYDPAVLKAVSCVKNPNGDFDIGQCNPAYEEDIIRFNIISLAGISGDIRIADLTFLAIGDNGDSSVLDIEVSTIVDPTGVPLEISIIDGMVDIADVRLGDVNCDGEMTILDMLYVMQSDVRLRGVGQSCSSPIVRAVDLYEPNTYEAACDVTLDGDCNLVDALYIGQCDLRLRECPEKKPQDVAGTLFSTELGTETSIEQRVDLHQTTPPIQVGSIPAGTEGEFTVPVRLIGVEGFAAGTFEVTYDPTLMKPLDCETDPEELLHTVLCNTELASNEDSPNNVVRFNAIELTGYSGDVTLVNILFEITGILDRDINMPLEVDSYEILTLDSSYSLFLPVIVR